MHKINIALANIDIKRYLSNSAWMLAEQIIRIIAGVFVGLYVARYLGPTNYGILSYLLAITALTTAASKLGMEAIIVREIVKSPDQKLELMGTAFWLMSVAAITCYILSASAIMLIESNGNLRLYALILTATPLFSTFLIIDFYFQSQVKAKIPSICKTISLGIMSLFKIALILLESDLIYFVISSILDHAVLAALLVTAAHLSKENKIYKHFSINTAKKLLKSSLPMFFSAVGIALYMRIDQFMIKQMLGMEELGIYSAAVKIYESWVTFPFVLSISLLPAIVKLKQTCEAQYHFRLTQLFRLTIWISGLAALITTTLSKEIVGLTLGEDYIQSASIVSIMMWTAVFSAIGSISTRYMTAENMEYKIVGRILGGCVINIAFNLALIPSYGICGAAIATLICSILTNYMIDWFDRDLKTLLRIKHKAIFPFLR